MVTWDFDSIFPAMAFLSGRYTLCANMELHERITLSDDDMTAAETAPRPITPTAVGVRKRMTSGRASG